jgi:rhombotail lipoprotein
MSRRKHLSLIVPLFLCGCAHGFDRNTLQERLNDGSLQISDTTIAEARGLKPQLKFPCRVAIYLQPERGEWHWTAEDKSAMKVWADSLKSEGIVSDVFPLPEILIVSGEGKDKDHAKELRLAAAKCGADVLFVIHGAAQTDSYKNFASALNLTIIGGYVVPGSHRDSLFLMEGVLLDVDNGYVYTAVQTEGVGKIVRPTFLIEDKDAIARAKTKAVAQFGDEVLKRMRELAKPTNEVRERANTPPLLQR